jgi:two-component system sensor histidine kinase KdpD
MQLFINRLSKTKQYMISLSFVIIVAGVCFALSNYVDYKVIAFILLLAVSLIAISFDIFPVLLAAALSAFIWDFFFIPPRFTLHVGTTEDTILLIMYFIIALINAVLTYKIRQVEKIALKKEEKANTIKLYKTLLNSLSHEMRTPIATIIGATDNLQGHNENLSVQDKQQLVKEISKASFRLNQQVENLLNISRLESGFFQPKKDWTDVTEVIYDIVARIEENKVSQRISIHISQSFPLFKLDKMMLEQILYNLVNNACLHTEPKTTIHISAAAHADVLQIRIEDNGKGFPEEEISNVFEKFYRLKDSHKNGTGLGLSIVKGFTEALGGAVHLENISTGGARFTVEIPGETSYLQI